MKSNASNRCSVRHGAMLTILLLVISLLSVPVRADPSATDPAVWLDRLRTLHINSSEAFRTLQEFALIDPDQGFTILRQDWPEIGIDSKVFLLSQLSVQYDPRILDILHLGATDPALAVQNRALQILETYSFQDFNDDYGAYAAWRKEYAGKSVEETVLGSARALAEELQSAPANRLPILLGLLQRANAENYGGRVYTFRRKAMLDSGLPEALAKLLTQPGAAWIALQNLRALRPDESFQRRVFLPLLDKQNSPALRQQVLTALAHPDNRWAADAVLKHFVDEYPDPIVETMAATLAQMAAPECIPTLISMLDADRSQEGMRLLGYTLNQLGGLTDGRLHDAAWWHLWWQRNSARFTPDVRNLGFRTIAVRPRPMQNNGETGNRPELHHVAADPDKAYWLIAPAGLAANGAGPLRMQTRIGALTLSHDAAQAAGQVSPPLPPGGGVAHADSPPGLLVVLSDGDGKAVDRLEMWLDTVQKTLQKRYYVAVVVAPKWGDAATATWTTRSGMKGAKAARFPIETFVAEVVHDVAAAHTINSAHIFLHGVAESGLAAYACSLDDTSPFKGFYVLSSPFKSGALPPLTRAKGRAYYIENSRDDKEAPFVMAEAAQKLLTANGASAKVTAYAGGHAYGFSDSDPDKHIAAALDWLESVK